PDASAFVQNLNIIYLGTSARPLPLHTHGHLTKTARRPSNRDGFRSCHQGGRDAHPLCVCACVCVVCVCHVWCCAAEAHHATCAITGAKRRGSYAIERPAEPAGQTPGDPPSSGCT